MAGGYSHVTTEAGNLRSNESFVNMIENLGDAYEMAEEMYGMIWVLASQLDDPRAAVADAQERYREGLVFAREVNG